MIGYIVGLGGMWMLADGVASLWTYLPDGDETWLRNHSLRLVRCIWGVALMVLGALV